MTGVRPVIRRVWKSATAKGVGGPPPHLPEEKVEVRVTLRQPPWSEGGYGPSSPGSIWWYQSRRAEARVVYGKHILDALRDDVGMPVATQVHLFHHRYSLGTDPLTGEIRHESLKDRNTWHSGIFLEWDHGKYGTVLELALRNGIGGYGGKVRESLSLSKISLFTVIYLPRATGATTGTKRPPRCSVSCRDA
uniref:Uncharacterized protein n=1 Tax=Corethron hystrix TaxID=216773 RepID=A0A7S1FTX8_9STRA